MKKTTKKQIIMEYKIKANITMSKVLTVEAEDLGKEMEKAQQMMGENISIKELTPSGLTFELLSPLL
jgi:hypothetical protein